MLVTELPTLLNSTYDAAEQLKVQVAKALTNAEMYPNSKPAIDAFFAGVAGDGGGGAELPAVMDALGAANLTFPTVAVAGTATVAYPQDYQVVGGVFNPNPTTTIDYGAIPAGVLEGFPGAVSFTGTTMTGVTEGLALATVNVTVGEVGPGQRSYIRYYSVLVSGGA